jgi:DNA ligase (NAD+)
MVADTMADALAQEFGDIQTLMEADTERLSRVAGFGPERAKAVVEFFALPSTRDVVARLRELGVDLTQPKRSVAQASNPFLGKTVVVTGTLTNYGRKDIEDKLKALGAKPSGSVSKKTDFLLAGEEAGSKLDKARDLGVKILSEADFEAMLAGG